MHIKVDKENSPGAKVDYSKFKYRYQPENTMKNFVSKAL